ncbi:glycosyl transferases group 1 family protein [Collimonas arenae]|uniref:Glycosyl transferases group 1 family protein n=2 Tax=Collimonas arenae TaxID=279058 RepID=A0A127PLS3_9BURK|nr:glycosyl transferases group 1 family protein [Collimonas arenae]AMP08583.1 glycosyl transferases group 1 family protein [Collimonas arenae]
MGEHIRTTYRALRSIGESPAITDVYKLQHPDASETLEFSGACTDEPAGINVFHINGDEVEQALKHLSAVREMSGYNIIYPLWELAKYPEGWAKQLDRFDEIWAPSKFIQSSLEAACDKPVVHMPLACEVGLSSFLGRRYFSIPETDYTFLFFYDLRSYSTRKNPEAVVNAFRNLLSKRPYSKIHLVIKVNGVETNPEAFNDLCKTLGDLKQHVTLFQKMMTSNEVKNLVRCCDCFVSLHRSEGFGFGIAEAMALGKPVIATAYSGNMDFMAPQTAYDIDYKLIPLNEGDYPHHDGQVWADPDWEQASFQMINLVDDPNQGRLLGRRAQNHMKLNFNYRSTGLRYTNRFEGILLNKVRHN